MDLEVEWGFDKSAAGLDYSGRIDAYDGMVGYVREVGKARRIWHQSPIRSAFSFARLWRDPKVTKPSRAAGSGVTSGASSGGA
jgi:hypothetical protein